MADLLRDPKSIPDTTVNILRGLIIISNVLFVITFVAQQFSTQQGPSDEELEPESDDDGIDTSGSEEETELGEDDVPT